MIDHLQPYPNYRDSRLPRLGKIPEQWEVRRGKWLFQKMQREIRVEDDLVRLGCHRGHGFPRDADQRRETGGISGVRRHPWTLVEKVGAIDQTVTQQVEAIVAPASGHLPAVSDESQMDVIKQWIDQSDVYLLILGGRYGSLEPNTGPR